jgi:prepilin-type N-terminal cleavage/methylation domain-containing protein
MMNDELRSRKRPSLSTIHYPLSISAQMRRALTLIEMIVAITVAATLTGIAMSLLLVMFRTERSGRTQLAQAQSLARLADQFRQDVHAAVGETVDGRKDPHHWQFHLAANQIVQYTVAGDVLSREQRGDSKDLQRESYSLPKDCTVAITVDRTANPPVVSLTVEPNEASLRPAHPFRVDAVLGRDLRFSEGRKEGK